MGSVVYIESEKPSESDIMFATSLAIRFIRMSSVIVNLSMNKAMDIGNGEKPTSHLVSPQRPRVAEFFWCASPKPCTQ